MEFKNIVHKKFIALSSQLINALNQNPDYTVDIDSSQYDEKTLNLLAHGKKFLSTTYQILGSYDCACNLFMWSSSFQVVDKMLVTHCTKIKKTIHIVTDDIINNLYPDTEYLECILYYLSNKIFFISDLDNLLEYCVHVTESQGYVKQMLTIDGKDKINIYLITDIIGT
jgi:hypothetical protein